MSRRISILLLTIAAFTVVSAHADEWKKDFTTAGKLALKIETNDANITVTSWDQKDTHVEVTTDGYKIGPSDVRIIDHQTGDRVDIDVHRPTGRVCFGVCNKSVRIDVHVPREADVALNTRDGNIQVDGVKGDLRLDSGDGNLDIRSVDGRLGANTGDGHIRAEGRFDALDVHTGDGNIDADVHDSSVMNSSWLLRTGDGNISLAIPSSLSADLDVHTGDGHVNVDFPVTVMGSMHEDGIRGKINGGGPILEVRTGDGTISVRKN